MVKKYHINIAKQLNRNQSITNVSGVTNQKELDDFPNVTCTWMRRFRSPISVEWGNGGPGFGQTITMTYGRSIGGDLSMDYDFLIRFQALKKDKPKEDFTNDLAKEA